MTINELGTKEEGEEEVCWMYLDDLDGWQMWERSHCMVAFLKAWLGVQGHCYGELHCMIWRTTPGVTEHLRHSRMELVQLHGRASSLLS
jgi:hypothetical protein